MPYNKTIGVIINETGSDPELSKPKNIRKVNGHVEADCILQETCEKNRNGRYYTDEELFPAVLPEFCPRTKELLEAGTLRAESGHPDSKDLARQQKIEKKNCSAIFLKMWRDNHFLCASYRGTNNELGKELEQDLLDGYLQSWSMRSLGSVVNTEKGAEVKGVKYITHDEVIYPSHPRAYTKGIQGSVKEGASSQEQYESDRDYILNESGILIPIINEDVMRYIKAQSANLKTIRECFDVFYDDIRLMEDGKTVYLNTRNGDVMFITLEDHIHNDIMDYVNHM